MADPSMDPDKPDVTAIASFLRRFAGLMSTGQNAAFLHHAAILLEDLTARLTTAIDEEHLWQYKYTTATDQADRLEVECDSLKRDIDGHVEIISSTLAERDGLRTTLQAREQELSELRAALARERDQSRANLDAHNRIVADLGSAFDQERQALKATIEQRGNELDQHRLAFVRERAGLLAQLTVSGDELEVLRAASRRECDELRAKVVFLESKRTELRSAFERISDLRNQTIEQHESIEPSVPGKPGLDTVAPLPEQWDDQNPADAEGSIAVPRTTLRQARAQFEYLAKECISRGDIASQVMCELGAYTMNLALSVDKKVDSQPVSEMALSILAPAGSTSTAKAGTTSIPSLPPVASDRRRDHRD
jgi:hypothetical protein